MVTLLVCGHMLLHDEPFGQEKHCNEKSQESTPAYPFFYIWHLLLQFHSFFFKLACLHLCSPSSRICGAPVAQHAHVVLGYTSPIDFAAPVMSSNPGQSLGLAHVLCACTQLTERGQPFAVLLTYEREQWRG